MVNNNKTAVVSVVGSHTVNLQVEVISNEVLLAGELLSKDVRRVDIEENSEDKEHIMQKHEDMHRVVN